MKVNTVCSLLIVSAVKLCGLYYLLIGLVGEKKVETDITPIPRKIHNVAFTFEETGGDSAGEGYKFPKEVEAAISSAYASVFHSKVRYRESVSQIVLVVIDAMRVDFLSHDRMPFVSSLLDNSFGCVFVANVKAPTVTLPRIKAMMTGDVSTYWDIIQNFQSQKMTQDNILWHASQDYRKRVVFYGDETWIKLFPDTFLRSEGVTSFFVSDFKEVDENVTRHLENELSTWVSWDMLILHFLGLDHIGHVHGPNSKLIPSKLLEMDRVVQRIYEFIRGNAPHSMIILCGDHGMANIGGHGGNSYPEVTTPLIFLSTRELTNCYRKDWRFLRDLPTVNQVDMAPTISALWGLMFPAQSTGKIVPDLLGYLPVSQHLFALYYNALHLRKFVKRNDTELMKEFNTVIEKHLMYAEHEVPNRTEEAQLLHSYTKLLHRMSESAGGTVGYQDLTLIANGVLLCLQAILLASTPWKYNFRPVDLIIVPALTLLFLFGQFTLPNVLVLTGGFLLLGKFGLRLPNTNGSFLNYVHYYAVPLAYFSSSFIEEEHMIRYYLWTTVLLLLVLDSFESKSDSGSPNSEEESEESEESEFMNRSCRVFSALLAHRIAMAWNQTGQKWTDLNDLVDFLKEWNLVLVLVPVSLVGLYWLRRERAHFLYSKFLFILWLIKMDTGLIRKLSGSLIQNEAQLGYVLLLVDVVVSLKSGFSLRSTLLSFWTLLSILLHRLENIPLIVIILYQVQVVSEVFRKVLPVTAKDVHNMERRLIYILWFSYAAFYYQGNSNNIASIDVNAGYIGLDTYSELLVGLLIFCNTFSAPLLVFLGFWEQTLGDNEKDKSNPGRFSKGFFIMLVRTNAVTVGTYSIVLCALRQHLFIWTVFTPKLLYVIAFTAFYTVLLLLYGICTEVKNRFPDLKPFKTS